LASQKVSFSGLVMFLKTSLKGVYGRKVRLVEVGLNDNS